VTQAVNILYDKHLDSSMRSLPLVAVVFSIVLLDASFQKAGGKATMRCMEKCISYEGGNSEANKVTCKSRCGAAFLKQLPIGKRDCMGEFKSCSRTCGKENIGQPSACHKQCKVELRTCT
jgi:hypothetical protein